MKNHHHSDTQTTIDQAAIRLVAKYGCHSLSMRDLAKEIPLSTSVLYFYYANKDDLLLHMYQQANRLLGEARSQLPPLPTTQERLQQLVEFQLQHAELIVAVLRYYLYKRDEFHQTESGALPEKATLHVEEVLEFGLANGEIQVTDIKSEAKVITHAINGYLLEYFPYMPIGLAAQEMVSSVVYFIMRSLQSAPQVVVGRNTKQKGSYVH